MIEECTMKTGPLAYKSRLTTDHPYTLVLLSHLLIRSLHKVIYRDQLTYKPTHFWDLGENQNGQRKPTWSQGNVQIHTDST